MEESAVKTIALKDVSKWYKKYKNPHVRYNLKIMVTSKPWITNNKLSVWIEDPIQEGKTILGTYGDNVCEDFNKLKLHGQFNVNNVRIVHNSSDHHVHGWPTYAAYQLVLDGKSKIIRANPVDVKFKAIDDLAQIPSIVGPHSIGEFLDLIAVPVQDLGSNYPEEETSPRRIKMVDPKSNFEIIWTLWNADKNDVESIQSMMEQPILIRNGIVKFYRPFNEWQVRSLICNVRLEF